MAETLVSPTGTVMEAADPAEAARLKGSGWSVATAEQSAEHSRMVQYGGLGGTAAAFGAGALRGATLGGSDYALSALGGDELQSDLRALREVNPGASMAGEVAGDIASMAIPIPGAGAGALARGASGGLRALSAPARALTRVGEAVGAAAGRRFAGRTASSMAEWAARGAVEGAGFGVQQTLTEDALGERELTGEGLLASVGWGAATGGIMGGAIAGTGAAVRGGLSRIANAKGGTVGEALGSLYQRLSGAAGVEGAEGIGRFLKNADDRAVLLGGRKEAQEAAARFVKLADEMEGVLMPTERTFKGGQKLQHIRREINPAYSGEALEQSRGTLAAVVDELDGMIADGGSYARGPQLKKVRDYARKQLSSLDGEGADAAMAFMALDRVKRDLAKRGMGKKLLGATSDELTGVQQATKARLKRGYLGMQDLLERRDWWGNAGKVQEEMNAAWAKLIPEEADRGTIRRLYEKRTTAAFEKERFLNKDALARALQDPTSETGTAVLNAMRKRLENGAEFMAKAEQHLGSGGAKAYRKNLSEAQGLLGKMDNIRGVLNEFDAIGQGGGMGAGALAALGGVAVGSGAVDPEVAGGVGLLASAVLNPRHSIRQLAAAEQLASKAIGRMRKMSGKAVGKSLIRQSTRATSGFSAWSKREQERSEKAAEIAASADPIEVERGALVRLGALDAGAPEAVAAAGRAALRGAMYLKQHAPRGVADLTSTQPLVSRVPDDALSEWNARRRAVDRPVTLLQDMAAGLNPHPAAIDAVRSVYPELYQRQIVDPLLSEVEQAAERGHVVDYDTAVRIQNVTGQAVSPLDAPELSEIIAAAIMGSQPVENQPPEPRGDDGQERAERAETEATRVMA